MKEFKFIARDRATNKIIKSSLKAEDDINAGKLLTQQGYIPLKIKELQNTNSFFYKISNRIGSKEKVVFMRQLATLIGAGLPVSQSFHTIYEQTTNKRFKAIIAEITTRIESGKTLSSAFSDHPDVFNRLLLSSLEASEASGTLDKTLNKIATQLEQDSETISKLRGAMIYPILVLVVIFGVLGYMMVSIVPQVKKIYSDLGKDVPVLTQILVFLTEFVINYWYIGIALIAILVFLSIQYLKTENGKLLKDNLKLKLPIIKKFSINLYMARFTGSGQTLLASGVTMLDMLQITSNTVNNAVVQKAIMRAFEKVRGGKNLSQALLAEKVFPTLVPRMIEIGEKSGKIDEVLEKTCEIYQKDIDQKTSNISTIIEPILMIVLAIFAGVIVIGVLYPIYTLTSAIQGAQN